MAHAFAYTLPYAWGGCRFVCTCGASGQVVPDEVAARAEHQLHVRSVQGMAEQKVSDA